MNLERAIDAAPAIINQFLNELMEHTGFKWSIIGGGRDPCSGGQIRTMG